nr:PIN/TRAM domain-containing protein [Synechococcus elongatus PCC 11801]
MGHPASRLARSRAATEFAPLRFATMLDALIILLFLITGAVTGFLGVDLLPERALQQVTDLEGLRFVVAGFTALFGGLFGLLAQATVRRLQLQARQMPTDQLISRAVGLILGLVIANLILTPVFLLPIPTEFVFLKPLAAVIGSIAFGMSGITLADTHGRTLLRLVNPGSVESALLAEGTLKPAISKVIDTSCIIDGRIEALIETGFLEGRLIVPQFVLQELQQLADASNDQKRSRGRRGLDVLNRLRETYANRISINSADYDDISTVDAKLVRLAQDLQAPLLTVDYNLNRVASIQEVTVLNINDLAKTLRPTYLPGDRFDLRILKEGKEAAQGVGYLEDGTMVVVEEGRPFIGSEIAVMVTGALQTSAGRLIFAKPVSLMPA